MNTINIGDLKIDKGHSYQFDQPTLCARNHDWRKIDILYISTMSKVQKDGLFYCLSECNLNMIPDFRSLLEKNLILLHTDQREMFAFFDLKGKISKNSKFCGGTISKHTDTYTHSYNTSNGKIFYDTSVDYKSNKISIDSFKMMDKKTSEHVKKTLMDIAWWFDKIPNESKRQYELIPKDLPSSQIQQFAQPIFTKSTTSTPISSQNKPILIPTKPINSSSTITNTNSYSSTPTKPSTNISSQIITHTPKPANNIILSRTNTNTPISSFTTFDDFQGNNFEKDANLQPSFILQEALILASTKGYTNFSIKSSFDENESVQVKPYIHSITGNTCHEARVNFYITASNTSGKSIKLILQREFFAFHSIEKDALEAINRACESAKKDAAAT